MHNVQGDAAFKLAAIVLHKPRCSRNCTLESRTDELDDVDDVKAKIRLGGRKSRAESRRWQEEARLH